MNSLSRSLLLVMTFVDLVAPKGAVFVDCIMQCFGSLVS